MKKLFAFSISTFLILGLAACGSSKTSSSATQVSKNVLTGMPGIDGKVLAVKIDDTPPAHPQIGLDNADVVYIEQVEGGLTRLATIFSNPKTLPDLIGPVRSARISDIDILAQYGHVAFAFSGAQTKLFPVINSANLENMGAEREPATLYSRDQTRNAPTNLILHPQALLDKAATENKTIDTVKSVGWKFGAAPVGGKPISSVTFRWPASRYGATWSKTENRWLLTYNGEPDLAASGKQLGGSTLILQKVTITPSEYHDKAGGITPFSNTVGSGTAYLLRDGAATPIFWNRASADVGTTWTLKDGTNANFAPGQIWIGLTDNEPVFTYPATPTPSKSPKN